MDTQETIQKLIEDVAQLKEDQIGRRIRAFEKINKLRDETAETIDKIWRQIKLIREEMAFLQKDVQSHCHVRETEKTSPTNFCNAISYGPQQRMTRCLQDFGHGGLHDGEEPKRVPEAGKNDRPAAHDFRNLIWPGRFGGHPHGGGKTNASLRAENEALRQEVVDFNRKLIRQQDAAKLLVKQGPCNESLEALRGGLYRVETCILPGGHLEKHQSLEDLQEKISTVNQDNQRLEKERDVFQKENHKLRGSLIHHIQRIEELEGRR